MSSCYWFLFAFIFTFLKYENKFFPTFPHNTGPTYPFLYRLNLELGNFSTAMTEVEVKLRIPKANDEAVFVLMVLCFCACSRCGWMNGHLTYLF